MRRIRKQPIRSRLGDRHSIQQRPDATGWASKRAGRQRFRQRPDARCAGVPKTDAGVKLPPTRGPDDAKTWSWPPKSSLTRRPVGAVRAARRFASALTGTARERVPAPRNRHNSPPRRRGRGGVSASHPRRRSWWRLADIHAQYFAGGGSTPRSQLLRMPGGNRVPHAAPNGEIHAVHAEGALPCCTRSILCSACPNRAATASYKSARFNRALLTRREMHRGSRQFHEICGSTNSVRNPWKSNGVIADHVGQHARARDW